MVLRLIVMDFDHCFGNTPESQQKGRTFLSDLRLLDNAPNVAVVRHWSDVARHYHYLSEGDAINAVCYPSVMDAEEKMGKFMNSVHLWKENLYMAFASRIGHSSLWVETPMEHIGDLRWSRARAYPQHGLIDQALKDRGVRPKDALFVADRSLSDVASNAGVKFSTIDTALLRTNQLTFRSAKNEPHFSFMI